MTVSFPDDQTALDPDNGRPPILAEMIGLLDTVCSRLGKRLEGLGGVLGVLEARLEPVRLRPEHALSAPVLDPDDSRGAEHARCSQVTSHVRDRVFDLADLHSLVFHLERRVADLTAELEV